MARNILMLILLSAFSAAGQPATPVVKGTVDISISKGTMDCNFILGKGQHIDDYLILINSGMNIRYIRDAESKYAYYYDRTYDQEISYESFGYYLPDNTGKGKFLRQETEFSYTGKFPVIPDTIDAARMDWKGNIAFNGYSVRTDGSQAAWYPVLYDIKNDKTYDKVRYDITINCDDCTTIYLNGNNPVPGSRAHLKSDEPMEMLLYAGRYKVNNVNNTFFLNAGVEAPQLKEFGVLTNKFKNYYEQKLDIPYKYNITYLNTTPVSKDNAWLFVSYPTIAVVGHGENGIAGFFDNDGVNEEYAFIAHELAHYYFGSYRDFNSSLGDAIGEGFAEYMSAQVMRVFGSDTAYKTIVKGWMKNVEDFEPVPISKINSSKEYGSRQLYVYNYMPLLLTAIEHEVGMAIMWQWMKNMLTGNAVTTDYKYLQQALTNAVQDKDKILRIRTHYFEHDNSMDNIRTLLIE